MNLNQFRSLKYYRYIVTAGWVSCRHWLVTSDTRRQEASVPTSTATVKSSRDSLRSCCSLRNTVISWNHENIPRPRYGHPKSASRLCLSVCWIPYSLSHFFSLPVVFIPHLKPTCFTLPPPLISLLSPGLPPRTITCTVSSELLGFCL